ncbi:MAG: trypsin-like peptidase domain-containing protein [Gammaproteobacteria bacterium]|nr:trypsin-like peptidase domain-containing protein [Gammaproteobacteria bacterium]
MATETKRISQQELMEKLRDIEVSDEELANYFIEETKSSDAFKPVLVPNPKLVKDDGLEGAFIINSFNSISRWRRNRKYKSRMRNWDGIRVVAEGDSWFQYPFILKDTIDQLIDLDNFQYAIYGLSEAGDLLSNIVREDEITEAIENEDPHVFLISGGGNDMVGNERIATMVHPYSANRKAENYPNEKFSVFLNELERLYRRLFDRVLSNKPHLKIICHGYDNAIPQNGTWLGKPLAKRKIIDPTLQYEIIKVMIGRFNELLKSIIKDYPGSVYHVDCRELIGTKSNWHDELHPKDKGYFKVAKLFDKTIKKALNENAASPSISIQLPIQTTETDQKEIPVKLAKLKQLDNTSFLNLVVTRAERTMGKKVPVPKTDYERRQLEADIGDFFEKVHKEANFLPSSFLEHGVKRAQSVCRIVTDTSYGSGSLIASRNFIMTNNHVIPNISTAELTIAEFDYDEDDILYTVTLKPDVFFMTNSDLDFTIVACDPSPLPTDIEAIPLLRDPQTVTRNERVNIIQHPKGRKKEISLHDNKVTHVYDNGVRYTADTEPGSSGSPVFNNEWDLVALHHAGWSEGNNKAVNEGIRMAAIVEYVIEQQQNEADSNLDILIENIVELSGQDVNKTNSTVQKVAGPKIKSRTDKSLTLNLNGDLNELTINLN